MGQGLLYLSGRSTFSFACVLDRERTDKSRSWCARTVEGWMFTLNRIIGWLTFLALTGGLLQAYGVLPGPRLFSKPSGSPAAFIETGERALL